MVLVELAQPRPVALLPERPADTMATGRRAHPGVEVMARDRAPDDARGAPAGAPEVLQGADRLHLLDHLREGRTR